MTSLMTNVAAMTALRTLQQTNQSLDQTQNRISTGYRVAEAKDNAAYWSIATGMRSDNMAMSAVKDSLGIGAATIDTAYTAMSSARDVLDEIKAKLTTATQDGIDRTKVQDEIGQLQKQLKSIAESASFSGENLLAVSSDAAGFKDKKSIVSSFQRDQSGALMIGTIDVNVKDFALYDSSATSEGILDAGKFGNTVVTAVKADDGTAGVGTAGPPPTAGTATSGAFAAADAFTLEPNDAINFTVTVDGGSSQKVSITKGIIDRALKTTDGVVGSQADYAKVFKLAVEDANVAGVASVNIDASDVATVTSASTGTTSTVAISAATAESTGIDEIDITNPGVTAQDVRYYISVVDEALKGVTAGASALGSIKNRIDLQTSFVGSLMDAIDRGVGTLVDADMTEESTKLKALQTQQQLGVQALSIANSSSQSILQLFK